MFLYRVDILILLSLYHHKKNKHSCLKLFSPLGRLVWVYQFSQCFPGPYSFCNTHFDVLGVGSVHHILVYVLLFQYSEIKLAHYCFCFPFLI